MEENNSVPYIAHEAEVARQERTIKRLTQIIIICVAIIFATNALWLYFWNQYEYVGEETSVTQDGLGVNIIGACNEVNDGSESNGQTESETEEVGEQ